MSIGIKTKLVTTFYGSNKVLYKKWGEDRPYSGASFFYKCTNRAADSIGAFINSCLGGNYVVGESRKVHRAILSINQNSQSCFSSWDSARQLVLVGKSAKKSIDSYLRLNRFEKGIAFKVAGLVSEALSSNEERILYAFDTEKTRFAGYESIAFFFAILWSDNFSETIKKVAFFNVFWRMLDLIKLMPPAETTVAEKMFYPQKRFESADHLEAREKLRFEQIDPNSESYATTGFAFDGYEVDAICHGYGFDYLNGFSSPSYFDRFKARFFDPAKGNKLEVVFSEAYEGGYRAGAKLVEFLLPVDVGREWYQYAGYLKIKERYGASPDPGIPVCSTMTILMSLSPYVDFPDKLYFILQGHVWDKNSGAYKVPNEEKLVDIVVTME